jgi:hypothetical protein
MNRPVVRDATLAVVMPAAYTMNAGPATDQPATTLASSCFMAAPFFSQMHELNTTLPLQLKNV